VATIIAVGVARPKAQGQDTTTTEAHKSKENSKLECKKKYQTKNVAIANKRTIGTKIFEIVSASDCIFALLS